EAEATAELIREGLLESKDDKKKSRPTSPNAAENFLSVVPDHLLPEGFQIAEILPERCRKKGIKFKDLPNSFRSAHDIAQRMHHTTLVPAELRQKIVDLSQKMALIVSGDPAKVRSQFVGLAKELQGYFEAAMRIYSLNAKTLGNRTSPMLLTGLMLGISRIIEMLEDGGHFGAEQIVVLNQAVLEALTDAQLLAILPPSERDAQVSSLGQSMIRLACYVETGVFSDLYPELAGGEELSHEVAAQLNVIRGDVFMALGPGLISLTHAMSRGLNAENETFDKSRIAKAASNAARAIVAAQEKVNPPEAVAPFFGRFSGLLTDIATELSRKAEGGSKVIKFNASQRRSIYHALIVALIRARRFMVFPEEHAPQQLVQTLALLQQILDFTRTGSGSPLWPQT
ncbi:MAG: hypothetical protein HY073_03310, partial [Deltaproteobacteria bacterium]|nr:hypothetical protein [Deltaproteobacteria bacterium]